MTGLKPVLDTAIVPFSNSQGKLLYSPGQNPILREMIIASLIPQSKYIFTV